MVFRHIRSMLPTRPSADLKIRTRNTEAGEVNSEDEWSQHWGGGQGHLQRQKESSSRTVPLCSITSANLIRSVWSMRVPQRFLEDTHSFPLPMSLETNLYIYTGLLLILFLLVLFILLLLLCQLTALQLKGSAISRRWGDKRMRTGNLGQQVLYGQPLCLSLSLYSRSGAIDWTCKVELASYKD